MSTSKFARTKRLPTPEQGASRNKKISSKVAQRLHMARLSSNERRPSSSESNNQGYNAPIAPGKIIGRAPPRPTLSGPKAVTTNQSIYRVAPTLSVPDALYKPIRRQRAEDATAKMNKEARRRKRKPNQKSTMTAAAASNGSIDGEEGGDEEEPAIDVDSDKSFESEIGSCHIPQPAPEVHENNLKQEEQEEEEEDYPLLDLPSNDEDDIYREEEGDYNLREGELDDEEEDGGMEERERDVQKKKNSSNGSNSSNNSVVTSPSRPTRPAQAPRLAQRGRRATIDELYSSAESPTLENFAVSPKNAVSTVFSSPASPVSFEPPLLSPPSPLTNDRQQEEEQQEEEQQQQQPITASVVEELSEISEVEYDPRQETIIARHGRLGIPIDLVYEYAPSKADLPIVKFKRINDFGEYELFGTRAGSGKSPDKAKAIIADKIEEGEKMGDDHDENSLLSTTNNIKTAERKRKQKQKQEKKQEKEREQQPYGVSNDLTNDVSTPPKISSSTTNSPPKLAVSPTGYVRRGSTLRTHIPGCTCMRCRQARKNPHRLPTKLKFRCLGNEHKIVVSTMKKNNFLYTKRNGPGDWNVLWTAQHLRSYEYQGLNRYQRINQFPKSYEITRKDTLCRNMARMKEIHGERWFRFVPEGFVLPSEIDLFNKIFQANPGQAWIVKPACLSCGRGIFVTNDINEIHSLDMNETWQVSRYIDKPLIVNGYKFDLRIYVTVTSFNPLCIYIHEDGLTRFATAPYDSAPEHYNNRFMHLTNYSVNKQNKAFEFNEKAEADDVGAKWSLHALKRKMEELHLDHNILWKKIHHVIIMTFLSIEAQVNAAIDMHVPFKNKNCFQLFGFDILVDELLEPVLIEINFSPSLACGTPLDLKTKSHVIADTLSLACVQPYDDVKMKGRIKKNSKNKKKSKPKKKNRQEQQQQQQEPMGNRRKRSSNNSSSPTNYVVDPKMLAGLTAEERRAIGALEAEERVSNGYERIFPSVDGFMYRQFFDEIRPLNELMSHYLMQKAAKEREEEEVVEIEARAGGSNSRGGGSASVSSLSSQESSGSSSRRRARKKSGGGGEKKKRSSAALTKAALSHADKEINKGIKLMGGLGEPVLNKARRKARAQQRHAVQKKKTSDEAFRYIF